MHARRLHVPAEPEFLQIRARDLTGFAELGFVPPMFPVYRTRMAPLSAASVALSLLRQWPCLPHPATAVPLDLFSD